MVHVTHAELGLEAHGSGEELHKLSENVFMSGHSRIVDKHDSITVLLNRGPAFFTTEVTLDVPQLQVKLAEGSHGWWGVPFQVDDPEHNSGHYQK